MAGGSRRSGLGSFSRKCREYKEEEKRDLVYICVRGILWQTYKLRICGYQALSSTGIKMNLGSKGLLGFEDEHAKRPPKRQRQRKGNDSDKQPWILIINFIVEKLPSKTKS